MRLFCPVPYKTFESPLTRFFFLKLLLHEHLYIPYLSLVSAMQLITIVCTAAPLALLSLPTTSQAQASDSFKFVWSLFFLAQHHELIQTPV
jgi:hypothetical protein